MIRFLTSLLAAVALAPTAALAHHSPAAFDETAEVVFEGTIKEVSWKNPHIYFTLEIAGADGTTTLQRVQAGSASGLTGMGVSRDQIVVGERVTVRGFPNRRGAGRVAWGNDLIRETGEVVPIDFRSSVSLPPPEPTPATGLAGRWLPGRESLGGGFAVRSFLTAAGQASADDVEGYRAETAGCEPWPPPMGMVLPMLRDIAVGEDVVTISVDWMDTERIVRLDQSEHPADLEPTLQGHSIGRWEGDALVIDTVGFTPHRSGVGVGVASGPDKRVVERLSLTEDKLRLRYEITIEDPEHLTGPVSFVTHWDHRPDLQFSGETCDLEVARQFLEIE